MNSFDRWAYKHPYMHLNVFVLMIGAMSPAPAQAQQLDPTQPVQAYTTDDPTTTSRMGLATTDGRYAMTPLQDCDDITPRENVLIYPNYYLPPALAISTVDGALPGCLVRVEGRMDATPCFQTEGVCDVAAEDGPID